jgi:hypothetical protein
MKLAKRRNVQKEERKAKMKTLRDTDAKRRKEENRRK